MVSSYLTFLAVGALLIVWVLYKEKNKPQAKPSPQRRRSPRVERYIPEKTKSTASVSAEISVADTTLDAESVKVSVAAEDVKNDFVLSSQPPKNDFTTEKTVLPIGKVEKTDTTWGTNSKKPHSENLEYLFQQKSQELEKVENHLSKEVSQRKEFELVRNLLQNQIQETRYKNTQLTLTINKLQEKNEEVEKKFLRLEEKFALLQKDMERKNNEIFLLTQQLKNTEETLQEAGKNSPMDLIRFIPKEFLQTPENADTAESFRPDVSLETKKPFNERTPVS